jgi:hypothetical protein
MDLFEDPKEWGHMGHQGRDGMILILILKAEIQREDSDKH